jgi:hypothetical protein
MIHFFDLFVKAEMEPLIFSSNKTIGEQEVSHGYRSSSITGIEKRNKPASQANRYERRDKQYLYYWYDSQNTKQSKATK